MTIFSFHCRGKQLVKTICTAKYAVLQSQKKMILSVETLDTGLWNPFTNIETQAVDNYMLNIYIRVSINIQLRRI